MSDFMKMDIFFFIASVGVIVLTVAVAFIGYLVYRTMQVVHEIVEDARIIMGDAKEVSAKISEDIHEARSKLSGGLAGVFTALRAFGLFKRAKKKASQAKPSERE
jgi:hypothetical protein